MTSRIIAATAAAPCISRRTAGSRGSVLLAGLVGVVCLLALPAAAARPGEGEFRDGVVLVGFHPNVGQQQQHSVIALVGAAEKKIIGVDVHVLTVPSGQVLPIVSALSKRPEVRYAEPDFQQVVSGAPNDPFFPIQWGFQNTGQLVNGAAGTAGADERAVPAWSVTTGSRSVVVGIVDTGIQYNHADLLPNVWSNPGGINGCAAGTHGYNVLTNTCDPLDDDTSYNGHGSHVAGIIGAATNNGVGVAGVNWVSNLLAVKWVNSTGTGYTSDLITALDWIVNAKKAGVNVRVVNDSPTWAGTAASQALSDEIDLLGSNDILFVTAAGNTAQNNDTTPRYPCSYNRPNEICVAASDQNDRLWPASNYGLNTVQLAAPGENIYSTLDTVSTYGYISGTSMSAAQVAGTAALILSQGYLSVSSLRAKILSSLDVLPAFTGVTSTGGRLNICKAIAGCSTSAPVNQSLPAITGTTQQGQTLTTNNGTWSGSPTSYTYQWKQCDTSGASCGNISGATASTYTLTSSDVGHTVRAAVTATNGAGSTTATSAQTAAVTSPATGGIALVQSASVEGTGVSSVSRSFPGSNVAGDLIVAFVRMSSTGQTVSVADSRGNAYVDAVSQPQTTDGHQIHIFYAKNIAGGSNTVTAAFSSTNNHPWMAIYEYSGLNSSSPLDRTAHAQGTSSTPSSGATATTSSANELVFAGLGMPSSTTATVTAGSGYTLQQQDPTTNGSRSATETTTTTSTGSYSGNFSLSASTNWSAVVATFSATAVGSTPVSITTTSLPSGTQNTAYSATLAATGGATPYTWSIASGTLPAGMILNSSTGVISGTPTGTGTSSFTAQVTDSQSHTATQALTITINTATAPLSITTTSLPSGTQNTTYSATLAATGGVTPYTWSIASGTLPAGLALSSSTGVISGTPTTTGTSSFTVQVTDSQSHTASQGLSITISSGTSGGIVLQQSAAVEGSAVTSVTKGFSQTTTAGNLIIAFVRMSTTSQTVSVTDTAGNVYADAVSQAQTTDGHQIHIFYARNINAGATTVTATFSATNNHPFLAIYEYAGLSTTSPLDQVAHAQGSSSSVNTGLSPTTTASTELIFVGTGMVNSTTVSVTAGAGYTLLQQDTGTSRAANEAEKSSATGQFAGTFSLSGSTNWSAVLATFK